MWNSNWNNTMVSWVGNCGAGEPPWNPEEAEAWDWYCAWTWCPSHRAWHPKAPLPSSCGQRDSQAPNGNSSACPTHEPPWCKAWWFWYPSREQNPSKCLVACQQPGQLEKPGRVQAGEVLGRGVQGWGQWQWLQVPSLWCWKKKLPWNYSCIANSWYYFGTFGTEFWAPASSRTVKDWYLRERWAIQFAHFEAFYHCCKAQSILNSSQGLPFWCIECWKMLNF